MAVVHITELLLPFHKCNILSQLQIHPFRVRAINIAMDNEHLFGPWSEPGDANCYGQGIYMQKNIILLARKRYTAI